MVEGTGAVDDLDLATLLRPEILARLSPEDQAEAIDLMEQLARAEDGWPRVYVNRDTLRPYKPHTVEEAAFVYTDLPRSCALLGGEGSGKSTAGIIKDLNRVRRGMSGVMSCVAPETMINGVPIAERSESGAVATIFGPYWASSGLLEGRADLFRVVTQSGESVTVTRNHRFLTPVGWRRLEDLRVGSVIAADDRRWVQISSITFSRYGEFYDLMVPGAHHYSAHGLFHHNSPDLPHFQRSLWKEFQRWCPWDMVVPAHRRMSDLAWLPVKPFDIVFENNTYIHCLGVKNAGSLEGPNINWAHFDEARHYADRSAIVVLDGRIRIPGPKGEPPQMWFTTTPLMHWLFDFFGPVQASCRDCGASWKKLDGIEIQTGEPLVCRRCGSANLKIEDDLYHFKADSRVVRLTTRGNEPNTMDGFAVKRGQSLTAKEGEVLLLGRWGDIEEGQPFVPYILWWDQCREDLPPLSRDEPLIVALDAATGRQFSVSDCFALVGITRHPDPARAEDSVAVRFGHVWQAQTGGKIDFRGTKEEPGPERVLLRLCGYELEDNGSLSFHPEIRYHVIIVVVDPTELNDMIQRLTNANVCAFEELGQTHERYEADRQFLNLITQRRIAHDGDPEMRMHVMSADRRLDSTGKRMRIVKRTSSSRIDLAVAASMGSYVALKYNL